MGMVNAWQAALLVAKTGGGLYMVERLIPFCRISRDEPDPLATKGV